MAGQIDQDQALPASLQADQLSRSLRPRTEGKNRPNYVDLDPFMDDQDDDFPAEPEEPASGKAIGLGKRRRIASQRPGTSKKQKSLHVVLKVSLGKTAQPEQVQGGDRQDVDSGKREYTDADAKADEEEDLVSSSPLSSLGSTAPSSLASPSQAAESPKKPISKSVSGEAGRSIVASKKGPAASKTPATPADITSAAPPSEEQGPEDPRPEPAGKPPATATSRAALAETLTYYRSYQSGVYTNGSSVMSFYLGACDMERPHFDADVVITRCGGHHGTVDGRSRQVSDVESNDAQVRHMRNNLRFKIPIVLIVGRGNRDCRVKVPHEFNLMAWFQVTDIWGELKDGFKTYLYRLERVRRPDNQAWWVESEADMEGSITGVSCSRKACGKCGETSKQVFSAGWMCLIPDCAAFWKLQGKKVGSLQLTYNPDFLAERTEYPDALAFPFEMVPPEPRLSAEEVVLGAAYDRRMWKGMLCAECKHMSPRRKWRHYQCDLCGRIVKLPQPPLTINQIRDPHFTPVTGTANCTNVVDESVIRSTWWTLGHYVFRKYDLGHGNSVFHVQSNEHLNRSAGGPNDMLRELQTDDSLDLERRAMGNKTGKSEGLVNHFSENYGYPYKYIVAQRSRPFREAPNVVLRALEKCQWVAEEAIGQGKFDRFNEVLAVGYMQSGSMGYHDDGEKELGDTVVAMCIGGDATMKIRLKDQYFRGLSRNKATGVVDHHLRIPDGALFQEERRQLNAQFADRPFDADVKRKLAEGMANIIAAKKKEGIKVPSECKPLLELNFRHGDFFAMNGPDVQLFYEHGVSCDDKLRFALTSRHVRFDSLTREVQKDVEARKLGDYEISHFTYDGATDANPPSVTRSEIYEVPRL